MRSIVHRKGLLHVETPLGVLNVTVGLRDARGRAVVSVIAVPDAYTGEPKVLLRSGPSGIRLVQAKRAKAR